MSGNNFKTKPKAKVGFMTKMRNFARSSKAALFGAALMVAGAYGCDNSNNTSNNNVEVNNNNPTNNITNNATDTNNVNDEDNNDNNNPNPYGIYNFCSYMEDEELKNYTSDNLFSLECVDRVSDRIDGSAHYFALFNGSYTTNGGEYSPNTVYTKEAHELSFEDALYTTSVSDATLVFSIDPTNLEVARIDDNGTELSISVSEDGTFATSVGDVFVLHDTDGSDYFFQVCGAEEATIENVSGTLVYMGMDENSEWVLCQPPIDKIDVDATSLVMDYFTGEEYGVLRYTYIGPYKSGLRATGGLVQAPGGSSTPEFTVNRIFGSFDLVLNQPLDSAKVVSMPPGTLLDLIQNRTPASSVKYILGAFNDQDPLLGDMLYLIGNVHLASEGDLNMDCDTVKITNFGELQSVNSYVVRVTSVDGSNATVMVYPPEGGDAYQLDIPIDGKPVALMDGYYCYAPSLYRKDQYIARSPIPYIALTRATDNPDVIMVGFGGILYGGDADEAIMDMTYYVPGLPQPMIFSYRFSHSENNNMRLVINSERQQ